MNYLSAKHFSRILIKYSIDHVVSCKVYSTGSIDLKYMIYSLSVLLLCAFFEDSFNETKSKDLYKCFRKSSSHLWTNAGETKTTILLLTIGSSVCDPGQIFISLVNRRPKKHKPRYARKTYPWNLFESSDTQISKQTKDEKPKQRINFI